MSKVYENLNPVMGAGYYSLPLVYLMLWEKTLKTFISKAGKVLVKLIPRGNPIKESYKKTKLVLNSLTVRITLIRFNNFIVMISTEVLYVSSLNVSLVQSFKENCLLMYRKYSRMSQLAYKSTPWVHWTIKV